VLDGSLDPFNVEGYPRAIVFLHAVIGLFILRWKLPYAGRPFKIWLLIVVFFLIGQSFLLVAPFLLPKNGKGDTSKSYWAYPLVGIGAMMAGALYYAVLVYIMPKLGGIPRKRRKSCLLIVRTL
jgi:hypothetical protein